MQEEVENRTVNLAISTTKLTARTIIKGLGFLLKSLKKSNKSKAVGKQSIKKLLRQDQGVTNIDISKTDLKGFEKYARKYGIDYAITKDKSVTPPKYLVFFKAKDADAMTAAFNAYSAEIMNKSEKPGIHKLLQHFKDMLKNQPEKTGRQEKQKEQSR